MLLNPGSRISLIPAATIILYGLIVGYIGGSLSAIPVSSYCPLLFFSFLCTHTSFPCLLLLRSLVQTLTVNKNITR
jgi:ABC-type dipeptide/oligopeptide/nickel transport system permease subunit